MENAWEVGALYPEGGLNNIKWSQPDGPGTQVFPAQQVGVDLLSIAPFNELTGLFSSGCGHSINGALIQREYDYDNDSSCALICCELCGYVNYVVEPFEAVLDTVFNPIVVV